MIVREVIVLEAFVYVLTKYLLNTLTHWHSIFIFSMHIVLHNRKAKFKDEGHVTYIAHSAAIFFPFCFIYGLCQLLLNICDRNFKSYTDTYVCCAYSHLQFGQCLKYLLFGSHIFFYFCHIYINNSWNICDRNNSDTHVHIYTVHMQTNNLGISQIFIIWHP